jgi:hypothetical protein
MDPSFIVIGAGKCGTTSVYNYLDAHPNVFVSRVKETKFFAVMGRNIEECKFTHGDHVFQNYINNRSEYFELFEDAVKYTVSGEVSPQYLASPTAALHIKDELPDTKIIAILRDPVARAFSSYRFRYSNGWEESDFHSAFMDDVKGNRNQWVGGRVYHIGLYARHLKKYFDTFDRSNIHVCFYEDMVKSNQKFMNEIYEFLGVRSLDTEFSEEKFNVTRPKYYPKNKYGSCLRRLALQFVNRLLKAQERRPVIKCALKPFFTNSSSLSPKLREQLVSYYLDDICELEQMLDMDLSKWKR